MQQLSFGWAMANAGRGQWGDMVVWCGQGGNGGGGCVRVCTRAGRLGPKKSDNQVQWLDFRCAMADGSGGPYKKMAGGVEKVVMVVGVHV